MAYITTIFVKANTNWKDQLTAYDGQTITYDNVGNPLTYRDGMTFTWQNGRQLASSTKGGTTTTYTYNADGGRKTRTVGNKTYDYYYVDGVLYAMSVGNYTLYFMYDDTGRPYSFIFNIDTGSGLLSYTLYYKYNLQGDVVGIYNTAGTEMLWYTYDPWGKLLSASGPMSSALGGLNPFLYRGYVYDYETGLYYCNSRYYDPETGRWINADGELSGIGGDVLGYNMYAYCMNNPINMSDPTGDWPKWVQKAISTLTKTAKTIVSFLSNFTAEIGVGIGFRGAVSVDGIDISGGPKIDYLSLKVNCEKGKVDLGQEEIDSDVSLNLTTAPEINLSSKSGYFHSHFCDNYSNPEHDILTCENTIHYDGTPEIAMDVPKIQVDAYVLIGGSVSFGFDYKRYQEEVMVIWFEE